MSHKYKVHYHFSMNTFDENETSAGTTIEIDSDAIRLSIKGTNTALRFTHEEFHRITLLVNEFKLKRDAAELLEPEE